MNDLANYPALLNPSCPWGGLREATGLPNVKWCEETLCQWIAEPANTWSNLAFLVGAAALWWWARNDRERMLRFWAPASFLVGTSSLVYHASLSFLTQVLDFWGMYCFFALVLLLNLLRLGKVSAARFFPLLWAAVVGLTVLTVGVAKVHLPVQGIIVVLLLAGLATEALATRASAAKVAHRFLAASVATLGVGAVLSGLDASGRWCDPSSHLVQGHALWHLCSAAALVLAHFHYRQFRAQLS